MFNTMRDQADHVASILSFVEWALEKVATKPALIERLNDIRLGCLGELDWLGDMMRGKECGRWNGSRWVPGCDDGCPHDVLCELCDKWGARHHAVIDGEYFSVCNEKCLAMLLGERELNLSRQDIPPSAFEVHCYRVGVNPDLC